MIATQTGLLADIRTTVEGFRYTWADERQLQASLYFVLDGCFIHPQREFRLTARDRIDFLCTADDGTRIGVEVKVAGNAEGVARQLLRYAPHVDALLLVTTRRRHTAIPTMLDGKPVDVAVVGGAA